MLHQLFLYGKERIIRWLNSWMVLLQIKRSRLYQFREIQDEIPMTKTPENRERLKNNLIIIEA
jgi:hypothetical protein